eukprot:comp5377_c0_seq1/m.1362 comp5377_c0_seq1/g.1362  ORF comp5377_c0_seq1/g.1362 comp5377_c0_seq1/m.1362 type:complete len:313 (-) comp5377_c0_seq1:437-1375(-)
MLLHTLFAVCLVVGSTTLQAANTAPKQAAVCKQYHDGLVKYGPVAALSHCVRITCMETNCDMTLREDMLDVSNECDMLLLRDCGLQPNKDTLDACNNLVQKYLPSFKDNLMMHSNWYRVTCGEPLPISHAQAAPAHTSTKQHPQVQLFEDDTQSLTNTNVVTSDNAKPKAAVQLAASVTSETTQTPIPTSSVVDVTFSLSSPVVSVVSAETLAQSSEPITSTAKVDTSKLIIYVCVGVGVSFLLCTAIAVFVLVRQRKANEARMRWREESADDFASERISATLLPKRAPPPLPPKKKTSGIIGMPERGTKAV